MLSIQALTDNAQTLSDSIDRWNLAYLICVFATVVLASATFVAQFVVIAKGKKLSVAQSEIIMAKDAQTKLDLKEKDLAIAGIKNDTAEAHAGVEGAKVEAAKANREAAQANERSAGLERENIILQQKLANRRISKEQHQILVDFLSKRRGHIIIETMGDSESGLFAADILKTLEDSGWTIDGKNFPMGIIWTGLIVYNSDDPDAFTIAEAFKAAGIPFAIGDEKRAKATIMVGGKPAIF